MASRLTLLHGDAAGFDDGLLLVGEPYGIDPPPPEAYGALGAGFPVNDPTPGTAYFA